jgi:hypothetical protein
MTDRRTKARRWCRAGNRLLYNRYVQKEEGHMAIYKSKVSRQSQLQKILSGLAQHYPNTTFLLGGVSYTLTDLTTLVQAVLDALTGSAKAKAVYLGQVQVERNATAKANPVLRLLEKFVVSQVGDTNDTASTLDDFGYTPRRSTKPTVAVKAVAVSKRLNTRVVRHIMGKKQRAKLTTTAPVTTPAASAAATTKA